MVERKKKEIDERLRVPVLPSSLNGDLLILELTHVGLTTPTCEIVTFLQGLENFPQL